MQHGNERWDGGYLSPDLVVVLAGTFLGPAFLVLLVLAPSVFAAACFVLAAPFFTPPFTFALPGLVGGAFFLPFGCVPVTFGPFPLSPPSCIFISLKK
jgi:hypothetical protein